MNMRGFVAGTLGLSAAVLAWHYWSYRNYLAIPATHRGPDVTFVQYLALREWRPWCWGGAGCRPLGR